VSGTVTNAGVRYGPGTAAHHFVLRGVRGTPALSASANWPPGRVPNMQDIDCIFAHPIKNLEWVANDGNDTDLGALRDAWSSVGRTANAVDDIAQAVPDSFGYRGTGIGRIIRCNLVEISERASRID
jgi:hypothetical protein